MKSFVAFLAVLLGAAIAALYGSAFIVHQNQQAVVLRFGEVRDVIREPGLNWKVPFIDNVYFYDRRLLDLDAKPQQVTSQDQKFLIVDSFARFRIDNPLLFYQRVRLEAEIYRNLAPIVESTVRDVLASATFLDIVRDKRDALMREVTKQVHEQAKRLGLEVVDVRLKRADLPEQNSKSIYDRMRAERRKEAEEFRAQGEAEANRIRAEAERKATVMRAEAQRDADIMRGNGDADRNRIFADAFNRDPNFFEFYRRMQACEAAFKAGETRFVISPGSQICPGFEEATAAAKKQ